MGELRAVCHAWRRVSHHPLQNTIRLAELFRRRRVIIYSSGNERQESTSWYVLCFWYWDFSGFGDGLRWTEGEPGSSVQNLPSLCSWFRNWLSSCWSRQGGIWGKCVIHKTFQTKPFWTEIVSVPLASRTASWQSSHNPLGPLRGSVDMLTSLPSYFSPLVFCRGNFRQCRGLSGYKCRVALISLPAERSREENVGNRQQFETALQFDYLPQIQLKS